MQAFRDTNTFLRICLCPHHLSITPLLACLVSAYPSGLLGSLMVPDLPMPDLTCPLVPSLCVRRTEWISSPPHPEVEVQTRSWIFTLQHFKNIYPLSPGLFIFIGSKYLSSSRYLILICTVLCGCLPVGPHRWRNPAAGGQRAKWRQVAWQLWAFLHGKLPSWCGNRLMTHVLAL